jgi:DNA-binding CsgD family transcriptional regulator
MPYDGRRAPMKVGGTATGSRDAPSELYGRERELDVLASLAGRLAEGTGGALLIRGGAGIGKSALLAAAAALAKDSGVRVLSAVGVQSEARLPFAGLHQLLRPVLPLAERLPPRQRAALLSAFGMADATASTLFLIGLAALELISDAAASSPVLLIADDAQWLDEPSSAALAFVARRLGSEPAVLLIALRDGLASPFDDAGLDDLPLGGLSEQDAGTLLDSRAPGLEPPLRARLIAEAAGNPLALIELPAAVRTEHRAGRVLPLAPLPITARLERAFAAQASGLPAATRSMLLVAATDDDSVLTEVLDAASALAGTRVTAQALAPAVEARLVETDEGGLRFRHPLVRSAIYQAASPSERRGAHAALADLLTQQPDRRAWHRAAAALGPQEQVAADLEAAAARANRRGAVAVAIDALRRAAQLSEDPLSKGRRLLLAAEFAFASGWPALGEELLQATDPLDLPQAERTWAAWKRETFVEAGWSGAAKIDSFVALADQMRAAGHTSTSLDALASIALRCYWGNPSQELRNAVIATAERLSLPDSDPALLFILASADPVQCGTRVNQRIRGITPDAADPSAMNDIGYAAANVWAWDRALPFLDAAVDGLRAQGRAGLLAQALLAQAWAGVHLARAPLAVSAADEAARMARETGQYSWTFQARLVQAVVTAARGDTDVADALTREVEAAFLSMGAHPLLGIVEFTRGRGAVINQRYQEGFAHLSRILDPADLAYHPFVGTWGLADLVEAAVHLGDAGAARAYLDRLESLAAATSGPLLRAAAAYARPLVATIGGTADAGDAAEALYEAALAEGLTGWPDYRARMLLSYGGWLRRQRRAVESRAPLREARNRLDSLDFSHLAEQARRELRAAGESSSRRTPKPWDQLTAQELEIARLAAEGMSNREIGQRLYISHRTVGAHLYRIFPKLGITTRGQLHAALSG